MRVKSQKLAHSLQSNFTFRAFSSRQAYHEGSMKNAPHLRESRFLTAILTADYVEDLSRSFNDVLGACLSLRANYPPRKSAVKLANGKATTRKLPATEVSSKAGQWQSYRGASSLSSMRSYSYGARWLFSSLL